MFYLTSPSASDWVALDASVISHDKVVVDAYVNDPLVYRGKITTRLSGELARVMQKLPHQMSKINLPILIMHGTADRLSDPKGSEMLYERVSSRHKTLKLYEGFYHEIFNEPRREQVFADMETWLDAHLTRPSPSSCRVDGTARSQVAENNVQHCIYIHPVQPTAKRMLGIGT